MKYFFIATTVLLFACKTTRHSTAAKTTLPQNISLNGKLFTALFQQRAAEYRALCFQAYNIARLRIDNYISPTTKPKAIITDIDETLFDNSPYAMHQAYSGTEFNLPSWYQWTDMAASDTMPGTGSFLYYVASKNVEIFYVTNREERERTATLKNLQRFNLPNADEKHLITKQTTSSKEARRQEIMQRYEVILLMGDNLSDFSYLFDKKNEEERKTNTDISAAEFGKKFIVFPNVTYGDWEPSLYKFNYNYTQAQKDSVLKTVLKGY